jgi:glycosyltransferase involved in cell wall biosynthesis
VTPVSIVIPVRNEGDRVSRTVKSIVAGRSRPFPLEIVIVDDASSDGCCETVPETIKGYDHVRLVLRRLDHWSGIPYARNRGVESSTFPICLLTDGNTRFPEAWDIQIWNHFCRGRILAGTIADMASSFRGYGCTLLLPSMGVSWIPMAGPYHGYVPVASSACTVISRTMFHQLGGYDETLPLYGAAEPEFSVRAWLSGYEIVNIPDLVIYHWFRPRPDYDNFRSPIRPIMLRNYLRFACYYLPTDLLHRAYNYFAELMPSDFEVVLRTLIETGVWNRRIDLQRRLPRDFSWLVRQFSLTCSTAVVP